MNKTKTFFYTDPRADESEAYDSIMRVGDLSNLASGELVWTSSQLK